MADPAVPTIQQILAAAADRGLAQSAATQPAGDLALRFPVVVAPATRAALDAVATQLNTSLAAVAGAILDGVAAASLHQHRER